MSNAATIAAMNDTTAKLEAAFAARGLAVLITASTAAISLIADTHETAALAGAFAALHVAPMHPTATYFSVREVEGAFVARLPLTNRRERGT